MGKGKVILSRARKRDGAPAVASRFLPAHGRWVVRHGTHAADAEIFICTLRGRSIARKGRAAKRQTAAEAE
jgi:hypothetical protein